MNRAMFDYVAQLVRARSGLVLSVDKTYLLESRLAPLARREGFSSIDQMVTELRAKKDERLAWLVTETMTTNETFFFRDKTPFELFEKTVLPAMAASRRAGDRLRIWCAACSTGQEPYSLAMLLDQAHAKLGGLQPEILATDICSKALEKAKSGVYSQFEVQRGLPVRLLVNYFEKSDEMWRISPKLQRYIQFRRFNLLDDYGALGRFDVIYCRNVLIYFDQKTKTSILDRMARQSHDDAYLFLGAAETVMGLTNAYKGVEGQRGLYRRAGVAARAA